MTTLRCDGPPEDMTSERLRRWAAEHLMYEVNTLVFAVLELGKEPRGMWSNVLLKAFVVHTRCLDDFLWRDRRNMPRDAFATDFCSAGCWEVTRSTLPQAALNDVRDRRRAGREVMHLTYDRIDGSGEKKEWPCGEVLLEIATALEQFAGLALPDRLDGQTRGLLGGLRAELSLDVSQIRAGGKGQD